MLWYSHMFEMATICAFFFMATICAFTQALGRSMQKDAFIFCLIFVFNAVSGIVFTSDFDEMGFVWNRTHSARMTSHNVNS